MAQGRSLWGEVLKNFIASFKINSWGELKGKDYLGTHYYESQQGFKRHGRPSRWFSPPKGSDFQQEIPPEWEAWLRHRRKDPPTEEEIQNNLLKMNQIIAKAKMLEKPNKHVKEEPSISTKFPTYEEYNLTPDKSQKKN